MVRAEGAVQPLRGALPKGASQDQGSWLNSVRPCPDPAPLKTVPNGATIPLRGGDLVRGLVDGPRAPAGDAVLRAGEVGGGGPCRDLVTLSARILVALSGGEREPEIGLGQVLSGPDAARQEDGEVVLAVAHAVLRSLLEPTDRARIVRLALGALRKEHAEIVHGLDVPGRRRVLVPAAGPREIAGHADALLVDVGEPELRRGEAGFGGTLEELDRKPEIL